MINTIKHYISKLKKYIYYFHNEYIAANSLHRVNYRGEFKRLDAEYEKYLPRFYFLMVALMFILSISSACFFYIFQRIFSYNSSILYDFRSSLAIWFSIGVLFMVTFLKPINDFIIRLILGRHRANEYRHYMYLRTLKTYDDSMYKLPKKTVFSGILLMVGFVLIFDYSVKIDERTIHFNDFLSIFQKRVYHFNQIDRIFFEPDSTKNFSSMDFYKLQMKDGFEWTFNSSAMEIDTSVFRFLSEKSSVKIDTLDKK